MLIFIHSKPFYSGVMEMIIWFKNYIDENYEI